MEISSETDSDDCQIYSNAAENIAKKRKIIDAKLKEYEKVLNLVNPDDIHSKYRHLLDDSLPTEDLTSSRSPLSIMSTSDSSSSDSEDSLSLSELLLRYQNERKKGNNKAFKVPSKSRKSTSRKSQQNNKSNQSKARPRSKRSQVESNATISGTVVLDDDTGNQTRTRSRPRRRQVETNATILGTVVLDDDSGYSMSGLAPIDFNSRHKNKTTSLDTSDISFPSLVDLDSGEDENIEIESSTVTIEWKGKEKTTRKLYEVRRYQKFETVFEDLAKLENIPVSRVLLMHNFETIRPSDTPSKRDFKHYVALTGCISKIDIAFDKIISACDEDLEERPNSDTLVVKLQQETHTFSVTISRNQKMSVLYAKCCEELKCPENKLKITFDGETVDPYESVADLDLEGGEIFHVYVKK